jgi:hypothetical protein
LQYGAGFLLYIKDGMLNMLEGYCYEDKWPNDFENFELKTWRFEPTMVVVLLGVLRSVLAMVGVVARVVIRVKIDITNGFGIWLF